MSFFSIVCRRALAPALLASLVASFPGLTLAQAESTTASKTVAAKPEDSKKYKFYFFYRDGAKSTKAADTQQLRALFQSTMQQVAEKAEPVEVNVADSTKQDLVKKYDVSRAPMPLVLAVAPNGAITRGLPGKFTEKDLLNAFASPALEKCLKTLQANKLVLLCVQNSRTSGNAAAMQGVKEFKADSRFGQATEIVTVDPADTAEQPMLKKFLVDPETKQAVTVFVAPPGSILGTYKGATDKQAMVATLTSAMSGCAGGCGPGGCGPAK